MPTADQREADPEIAWRLMLAGAPMRQGRSVGRTLYLQVNPGASNDDLLVGIMDSPQLAGFVAKCVNARRGIDDDGPPTMPTF